MRLSKIITSARNRELRQLSAKDKTDEIIVGYINLAMLALYSRFQLRTEEVVLNLKSGKTVYKLDGTDLDVYKEGRLFEDNDVMAIIKAFDEEKELSINKDNDPLSIFTISYDTVQVPFAATGEHIGLIYRASPIEVEYVDDGEGNAVDLDVKLPPQMLEAMLHHIGYSAHGSIDGNVQPETTTHLTRFERACDRLEILGLIPQDTIDMDTDRKGFL